VDDTPDCLNPLMKLLHKAGHLVEGASKGKEALDVMERFRPDSVILDLMMPIMDGITFLEVMRRNPAWQDVRVIVFTGYGDGLNARPLAELGVEEVFLKASINYGRLIAAVA
jgi:CheY-like chemotaxis protein